MRPRRPSEKPPEAGYALLAAIYVLTALFILGAAAFTASRFEALSGRSYVESVRSLYLADAGLATALSEASASGIPEAARLHSLAGGSAIVTSSVLLRLDSTAVLYRLRSVGTPDADTAVRKTAEIVVRTSPGRPPVIRSGTWRESM